MLSSYLIERLVCHCTHLILFLDLLHDTFGLGSRRFYEVCASSNDSDVDEDHDDEVDNLKAKYDPGHDSQNHSEEGHGAQNREEEG